MEINYRIRNKLSDEDKLRLVTDYNAGMKLADLVARYEVSTNTIYRILKAMAKKVQKPEIQTEPTVS